MNMNKTAEKIVRLELKMPRYGMVIDLKRCYGCYACSMACKTANHTPPGVFWARVLMSEVGTYPNAVRQALPVLCMQCEEPSCMEVCPTGATQKRDDGIVIVDKDKCMGCKYCILACPYDSRQFLEAIKTYYGNNNSTPYETVMLKNYEKGVVMKCDFCVDRLNEGHLPACVETCPAQARYFGDLDDPESEVSRLIAQYGGSPLREELGTKPSVYYIRG